jgi:pimeloyl-ACP methyl ester carboxylesterase
MTEPKTYTLDVPGAVLHYDVRDPSQASTEPVLLIIGSPMGADGFTTLAGHFTDRTVVTYDPRSAGRSKRTDGASETTPDEHADDLHRLISALDAGPVDIFASSGGAVNALALVAKHPEQVRTLVAHEPPASQELPDREAVLAACADIRETYYRGGFGPAMAKFIAIVSHEGPFPDGYADQPGPDPAMFGLPAEDDGSRDDPLLSHNIITCNAYRHDFDALRACGDRRRCQVRPAASRPCRRGRGRTAGDRAGHLPGRPRRVPRRRIRSDRRAGRLRRHPAGGPQRLTVRSDVPVALLVNQIGNMAVYPEELLFEPEPRRPRLNGAPRRGLGGWRFTSLLHAIRTRVGVSDLQDTSPRPSGGLTTVRICGMCNFCGPAQAGAMHDSS